jgi:hypothetical protein
MATSRYTGKGVARTAWGAADACAEAHSHPRAERGRQVDAGSCDRSASRPSGRASRYDQLESGLGADRGWAFSAESGRGGCRRCMGHERQLHDPYRPSLAANGGHHLARSAALHLLPRALWRSMRNYGRERDDLGPGCPEQFELSFFRDWVWTYETCSRARHAQLMSNLPAGIRGIILRSPREVRQFENNLPHSLDPGTT